MQGFGCSEVMLWRVRKKHLEHTLAPTSMKLGGRGVLGEHGVDGMHRVHGVREAHGKHGDKSPRKLFGTDGIRGKANHYPMTPELVLKLGKAIALHFEEKGFAPKVLIGKDTRLSGY